MRLLCMIMQKTALLLFGRFKKQRCKQLFYKLRKERQMKLYQKYGYFYLTIGNDTIKFEQEITRKAFIVGYLKAKMEFKNK